MPRSTLVGGLAGLRGGPYLPRPPALLAPTKAYNARLDSVGMEEPQHPIRVTVIVDGVSEQRTPDGGTTVEQLVVDLLPDDQKTRANEYQLSTRDGTQLEPGSRLEDDGISDGDILALTKRDGGGGSSCSRRQR